MAKNCAGARTVCVHTMLAIETTLRKSTICVCTLHRVMLFLVEDCNEHSNLAAASSFVNGVSTSLVGVRI